MFNKQKLIVLMVAALALTMSGTALAGSISQIDTVDDALYGQPNPFAAVENTTANDGQFAANDERLHNELQRASMKQISGSVDWESVQSNEADAANDGLYFPE